MPQDEQLADLAEFFRIFGDATGIRILYVLMCSEMCVCDIATLLGMTQSAISHQLRVLEADGSCEEQKRGQNRILFSGRWTY